MKNNNINCQQLGIKGKLASSRIPWLLAITLGLSAMLAQAEAFRYRYTPLDQIKLPVGASDFRPAELTNDGRVYGQVCINDLCSNKRIAYFKNGVLTVTGKTVSFIETVSPNGRTIAAGEIDPLTGLDQRILFHRNVLEHIPPQPDETFSATISVNDRHTALLESDTDTVNYVYYRNGLATVIDFGPTIINPQFFSPRYFTGKFLNNDGIIAGITGEDRFTGARGFRYDTKTGKALILKPLSGDNLAWGLSVNNRGDVLGYSFLSGIPPYHENIGVWDSHGRFINYFTETVSSGFLVFNDHNVIVITELQDGSKTSYLVPKPGVRLDIAKLVVNLPPDLKLQHIKSINNRGDMLGSDSLGKQFLLERLCQRSIKKS